MSNAASLLRTGATLFHTKSFHSIRNNDENPSSSFSPSHSFSFRSAIASTSSNFNRVIQVQLNYGLPLHRRSFISHCSSEATLVAHPDNFSRRGADDTEVLSLRKEIEDEAEVLIECRDVHKSFGEKDILRGASFKICVGEAVGIIGPSGTGKSTILRIMAGLLAPDKGEVFICGKKREGLISDEENPGLRIGLVFQSASLFDSLNVRENVGFMLYEHSNLSDEEINLLVKESLAAVGLYDVEERFPAELSGGMKKRVALARAIISDSSKRNVEREVVMYDEPTAGLDPIASTVVEDLIRSLHIQETEDGKQTGQIASYIVVTHQHSTIRRAVDRLLFLHEGVVVWEGKTSEFDTTTNPIVRQFADGSLDGPIRY